MHPYNNFVMIPHGHALLVFRLYPTIRVTLVNRIEGEPPRECKEIRSSFAVITDGKDVAARRFYERESFLRLPINP